jgi:hypothetical protein
MDPSLPGAREASVMATTPHDVVDLSSDDESGPVELVSLKEVNGREQGSGGGSDNGSDTDDDSEAWEIGSMFSDAIQEIQDEHLDGAGTFSGQKGGT